MDGLFWKTEYKKEPIAFGVFKLLIGVTVEDAKVSVDDLQEKIEAFEDEVQSVDIAAFNKVWWLYGFCVRYYSFVKNMLN